MQFKPEHRVARVIDIDGVVLHQFDLFALSHPYPPALAGSVEQINSWYDDGDYIYLWSARCPEYEDLTRRQLDAVGLKYHELNLGKPLAELIHIYDDKLIVAHKMVKNAGFAGQRD